MRGKRDEEGPAEAHRKSRRRIRRSLFIALIALALFLVLLFSPMGDGIIPRPLRAKAKEVAHAISSKARRTPPAFYTFTDDEDVVHIVDDLHKVPAKFRKRARRMK